jgi:hypothetical protein
MARFVTGEGNGGFDLKLDRMAELASPAGRIQVAKAIYRELMNKHIRYAQERYHPAAVLQPIRNTTEIFIEHEGTCLDLAVLFCGACLHYELLPVLIVLDTHALAGVFVTHSLSEWNATRPGRALFEDSPAKDEAAVLALVERGALVPVECTGMAQFALAETKETSSYPEAVGREGGVMSFERAQAAGLEQLRSSSRTMLFSVDIAVAHYGWRISPLPQTPLFDTFRQSAAGVREFIRLAEFEPLIRDHTRHFIGRKAVFERIDASLADDNFPSGYIVIQGEPGSGKSAIMSRLVQQRGYLHHFNIAPQNIRSAKVFLEDLCAQLIVRYELNYAHLPKDAGSSSGRLIALIAEALAKNQGAPIVMLVDALDESEPAKGREGRNRLDLPKSLPDGAFIVVSTREQMDYQLDVSHRKDIWLRDFREQTFEDVKNFIRSFTARRADVMIGRIRDWGLTEEQFGVELGGRSGGNFMYLVHILHDIAEGLLNKTNVDSIEALPATLEEYYRRHWRMMRDLNRRRYESLYEPVVCVLAAVHEPVTLKYVAEVTQLEEWQVKEVVNDWRQFLREDVVPGAKPVYRIYHKSFQDFLAEEVGLERFQRMITRTAVSKIPGLV